VTTDLIGCRAAEESASSPSARAMHSEVCSPGAARKVALHQEMPTIMEEGDMRADVAGTPSAHSRGPRASAATHLQLGAPGPRAGAVLTRPTPAAT